MDGVEGFGSAPQRARPFGWRGRSRRLAVAMLAGLSLVLAAVIATLAMGATAMSAKAATPNRAVVVVYVNGAVHTEKITFASDSITGLDALRTAGFDPLLRVFGGNGGAVCALDVGGTTIGCPADNSCLTCDANSNYWGYFRAVGGATRYTYSVAGGGSTQVHDGDVEAWSWGTGAIPTPFVSFASVWPDPPSTTTTRPTAPPTTARPPATVPVTVRGQGTATTIGSTAQPGSSGPSTSAPTTPTTVPRSTTSVRPGTSSTIPVTTSTAITGAATPDAHRGSRKVATAPVVARGGGGSPDGLIGFAVILIALVAAIVFARRRRTSRSALTT